MVLNTYIVVMAENELRALLRLIFLNGELINTGGAFLLLDVFAY